MCVYVSVFVCGWVCMCACVCMCVFEHACVCVGVCDVCVCVLTLGDQAADSAIVVHERITSMCVCVC